MTSHPHRERPTSLRRGVAPLALGLAILVTLPALRTPRWNFDCVGYSGVARTWLGGQRRDVHQIVYQELAQVAPRQAFDSIAGGSRYRVAVRANAEVFALQLPFYSSKPLYVALVAALAAAGVNSITACFWIAAASFAALSYIFIACMLKLACDRIACAASVLLLLSPQFQELGGLATPDSLAAALCLGGVGSFVILDQRTLGIMLLLGAVLTRPDSVIFAVAILTWALAQRGATPRTIVGGLFLVTSVAVVAQRLSNTPSDRDLNRSDR
jgi:hypothetical protein